MTGNAGRRAAASIARPRFGHLKLETVRYPSDDYVHVSNKQLVVGYVHVVIAA
jgi:hypothetical protein